MSRFSLTYSVNGAKLEPNDRYDTSGRSAPNKRNSWAPSDAAQGRPMDGRRSRRPPRADRQRRAVPPRCSRARRHRRERIAEEKRRRGSAGGLVFTQRDRRGSILPRLRASADSVSGRAQRTYDLGAARRIPQTDRETPGLRVKDDDRVAINQSDGRFKPAEFSWRGNGRREKSGQLPHR